MMAKRKHFLNILRVAIPHLWSGDRYNANKCPELKGNLYELAANCNTFTSLL